MDWIDVKDQLPDPDEEVLVLVKYQGLDYWTPTLSELENQEACKEDNSYLEPNSKRYWMMGSAVDYQISHWCRIVLPSERCKTNDINIKDLTQEQRNQVAKEEFEKVDFTTMAHYSAVKIGSLCAELGSCESSVETEATYDGKRYKVLLSVSLSEI